MIVDDNLWLWVNRELPDDPGDAVVLRHLADAGLPGPTQVETTGARAVRVNGWSDPDLAQQLARDAGSSEIRGEGLRVDRELGDRLVWSVRMRPPQSPEAAAPVRQLFVGLCTDLEATYGRGHLERHGRQLHAEHYSSGERTFYASGLYWLNWFGPGEAERQGGLDALARVAGARATQIGSSVFLEVGGSHLDAATDDGVRQLLAATASLPELPGDPDDLGPGPAGSGPVPETVNGVRGIRYPDDGSFWVNIHLDTGRELSVSRVADLAALEGSGQPPISRVNVLFSSEDSARSGAAALRPLGLGVWFVDDETGEPRPV